MKETIYFGTYTRRISEGIYTASLDTESGLLENLQLFTEEPSPSYLTMDKTFHLYSVGAVGKEGGIAGFSSLDGRLINHQVKDGAPLCYVAVDNDRSLVYGANYHLGQIMVYKKNMHGQLETTDMVQHKGSGPHKNQESPHAHFSNLSPDKYLVTCDLGTDKVETYEVRDAGKLTKINSYSASPGAGARHLVFHPTKKIAYLLCELNSTIEVLIYDGHGAFEKLQTISTLPKDYTGDNGTAAIRISKDGNFVYASNRGHNSIASYKVLADGSLENIQIISSQGKTPRDFNLSTDNKILVVANQDSDNVTTFLRDQNSGYLTEIQHDFKLPEGTCVYVD